MTSRQLEAFGQAAARVERVVAVVTAAQASGTLRNPLPVAERRHLLGRELSGLPCPVSLAQVEDGQFPEGWVTRLLGEVERQLDMRLDPSSTRLLTANDDVAREFEASGYSVQRQSPGPVTPAELLAACASGGTWEALAGPATRAHFLERDVPRRLAAILRGSPAAASSAPLGEGRNHETYGAAMDAALQVKLLDLLPFVVPGRVVDLGSGTGALVQALSYRFPQSAFDGIDLSVPLLRRAEDLTYGSESVRFLHGDVREPPLPAGCASTVIFSSVLHEVHSYQGYDVDEVRRALQNASRLLKPGGRLLVRDGVRPSGEYAVHLWCADDDLTALGSTRDRFLRFSREFKGGPPEGGAPHSIDEAGRFVCALPLVNEFLTMKDYVEHWDLEVREEFGVMTARDYGCEVQRWGLSIVHLREYVSPWIETNRYQGKVEIFRKEESGELQPEPWPATNVVLAAER